MFCIHIFIIEAGSAFSFFLALDWHSKGTRRFQIRILNIRIRKHASPSHARAIFNPIFQSGLRGSKFFSSYGHPQQNDLKG